MCYGENLYNYDHEFFEGEDAAAEEYDKKEALEDYLWWYENADMLYELAQKEPGTAICMNVKG